MTDQEIANKNESILLNRLQTLGFTTHGQDGTLRSRARATVLAVLEGLRDETIAVTPFQIGFHLQRLFETFANYDVGTEYEHVRRFQVRLIGAAQNQEKTIEANDVRHAAEVYVARHVTPAAYIAAIEHTLGLVVNGRAVYFTPTAET